MSTRKRTRRAFIKTVGLAAGATAFGCGGSNTGPTPPPPGGTPPPPTGETPPPPPSVRVRQDVSSLDPDGPIYQALRAGVEAMKAKAGADPTSWEAQARIHLDHCPHGNWFFTTWHRAYLYYFEEICREASGNPDFNLPYWNWTSNPQIPAPFWEGTLNHGRTADPGDSARAEFVGQPVIDNMMATSDFITFGSGEATAQRERSSSGLLEATPHNYVHGFVGGDMVTFLSPRDPIFWLHHCNVDRLWAMWNEQHPNTNDPRWLDFEFPANFVDAQGNPVDVKVSDTVSTFQYGYRYDTQTQSEPQAARAHAAATDGVEVTNDRDATSLVPLAVSLAPTDALRSRIAEATEAEDASKTLRLAVGGVEPPPELIGVRVFVNCEGLTADTPVDHPGYVGTFTFFEHHGEGEEHEGGERDFLFNVAATIRRLKAAGGYDESAPLDIQFVTVPLEKTPSQRAPTLPIQPSKVSLAFVGS